MEFVLPCDTLKFAAPSNESSNYQIHAILKNSEHRSLLESDSF